MNDFISRIVKSSFSNKTGKKENVFNRLEQREPSPKYSNTKFLYEDEDPLGSYDKTSK